jgi:hypothetical protein
MRIPQTLRGLLLVALWSAAYGQTPPLDQTRPDVVAKAYLKALATGDAEAAVRCLDPEAEGRGVTKLIGSLPREPSPDQTLTEMLLIPYSRHVQYTPGELVREGDTARLKLEATLTLPQTLVLRKGADGKWVVDLRQSATASTGRPESLVLRAIGESRPAAVAPSAACMSNLKQMALAVLMWAADHHDTLPPAKDWVKELDPYLRDMKVFRCPAAPDLECGYAYNLEVAGKMLTEIARPSETVLFYESTLGKLDAVDKGESQPRPGRHEGANHLAYVDGHAWSQPAAGNAGGQE